MMTLEQAKSMVSREEIHHDTVKQNKGKDCWRARLSSSAKTWKTMPNRVELRVVHGLKGYGTITEDMLNDFHLASECPSTSR